MHILSLGPENFNEDRFRWNLTYVGDLLIMEVRFIASPFDAYLTVANYETLGHFFLSENFVRFFFSITVIDSSDMIFAT